MPIQLRVSVQNRISSDIQRIQKELNELPKEAKKEFVKNTPIRSGNARRNTRLNKDTIEANYPYAQRLDEGYSKQSPDGMTKPTEKFIQRRVKQIMRKRNG